MVVGRSDRGRWSPLTGHHRKKVTAVVDIYVWRYSHGLVVTGVDELSRVAGSGTVVIPAACGYTVPASGWPYWCTDYDCC